MARRTQDQPRWWGAIKILSGITAFILLVLWSNWIPGVLGVLGVIVLIFIVDFPIVRKWRRDHPRQ